MKHYTISSAIITTLLSVQTFAGNMGSVEPVRNWSWVGTLSAGPLWARAGETQTFYLAPELEKTYAAERSANALASGEIFVGLEKTLSPLWHGQLGLAVATTGNAKLQGEIWDDADPAFNNYRYHYRIRNTRIAVKGKILVDKGYWLIPWVSSSIGVGFNRAHSFDNVPLIFEAVQNSNFTSNTKTAFSYTLGAGVQKALSEHCQIGIGYEFSDWGKNALGRAAGQTLGGGLTLNHLYTNGVLANLTYIV